MNRILYCLGFLVTAYGFYWLQAQPQFFDPDSLYHLFILSQAQAQHVWFLKTLPQLPELGWQNYFSDKEFLFHFILRLPFALGGEKAVLAASACLGAGLVWLPFFFATQKCWLAVAWSIFLLALQPHLLVRLAMLRPHVLAIFLFTALLWSLTRKHKKLVFILAVAFALSYHAFYIPLLLAILLLVLSCVSWLEEKRLLRQQAIYLFSGLTAGILLNPYFPSNIIRMLQHFALAIHGTELSEKLHVNLGMELQPLAVHEYFQQFGVLAVAVLIGIGLCVVWTTKSRKASLSLVLAGALTGLFFVASFFSPRAFEFMAPCLVLFLFELFKGRSPRLQLSLIGVGLVFSVLPFQELFQMAPQPGYAPSPTRVNAILEGIPSNATDTVFHCNWGLAPYILSARPQVKVIDILDPTFLWLAAPDKFQARNDLNFGNFRDPVNVLRKLFNAKYVICENLPLTSQLLNERNVILLKRDQGLALFRLD